MLELKISSPSSYLDLWAWSPESVVENCCFLHFFFRGKIVVKKKTELKPVPKGDAPEATVDLLQTELGRPAASYWAGSIGSSGGWPLRDLRCDGCGFLFPSQRLQLEALLCWSEAIRARQRAWIASLQHNKSIKRKEPLLALLSHQLPLSVIYCFIVWNIAHPFWWILILGLIWFCFLSK